MSPLRHEHFELAPLGLGIPLVEGHHLGVVVPDGGDLVPVLDDHAVARDDQPSPGGHVGYPVRVEHIRACDGHGARCRLRRTAPGSPGYVTSLRRPPRILPSPRMSAST